MRMRSAAVRTLSVIAVLAPLAGIMHARIQGQMPVLQHVNETAPAMLDPERDFIATPGGAYALMPAQFVCSQSQETSEWSSDGEYAFVIRGGNDNATVESILNEQSGAPKHREIVFWALQAGKVTATVPLDLSGAVQSDIGWLHGSRSIFITTIQDISKGDSDPASIRRTQIYRVAVDGTVTLAYTVDFPTWWPAEVSVEPSPTLPVVEIRTEMFSQDHKEFAAHHADPPKKEMVLVDLDRLTQVRVEARTDRGRFTWDSTGRPIYMERVQGSKTPQIYLINSATGEISSTPMANPSVAATKEPDLSAMFLKRATGAAKLKETVSELWLASTKVVTQAPSIPATSKPDQDRTVILVAPDAYSFNISPSENGILYANREGTFVRRLVKVSLDDYRKLRRIARKRMAINQAKQMGLAILMYSADYDNSLPRNGQGFATAVDPYTKDPSMVSGFHYSMNGQNLGNINSPQSTQLGYVDGPGGRAIVWLDGHVTWVPN